MDFSKLDGLIPAVIQDADSAEVLMVGFMNEEALRITSETGFATFFSRTRNKLWTKGETSGNRLQVVEMLDRLRRRHGAGEGETAGGWKRVPYGRTQLFLPRRSPSESNA